MILQLVKFLIMDFWEDILDFWKDLWLSQQRMDGHVQ
jgi:hypothetical protein